MKTFEMEQLLADHQASGELYHEFLRQPSMSVGIYKLAAGIKDPQSPHNQDEVYYVIEGRGQVRVADDNREVQPGSIIFVDKLKPHKFHTITEDLTILVFFAPAEG